MTLLLDTHVLLWALMSPGRLGPGLQAALTQPATTVLFSAASIWEIAIKRALGRPGFTFEPETAKQSWGQVLSFAPRARTPRPCRVRFASSPKALSAMLEEAAMSRPLSCARSLDSSACVVSR